ncbi:hypothetical protein CEQ90_10590 [Lewinellaceae bacterium SD302]|nr:hypothetical protein CEQ90_10590 [Lewinellaceae bacterium SD302]
MNDFASGANSDGCLSGEHQSSWYYFEIQDNAPPGLLLGFTLTPDAGSGEDYDFAVFGPDVGCGNLGSPIRCSFAGDNCAFCPQTGMGMGATDVSETPAGDGFVSMISVNPGEGYYLLIDNYESSSSGFSMEWTGPAAPFLNCIDCDADAGDLTANPNPTCPGNTINFSVSGFHNDPDYTQVLLVTDASGTVTQIINGNTGSLFSDVCATFIIYSYNYETAGGSVVPFVGMNIGTIDCTDECCDLANIDISFEDNEPPVFPNPPPNLSLSCVDDIPPFMDLGWTDNCDGSGSVAGTESGSADLCNGGTITRMWTYTDQCNNTGTHTQTITVDPPPPPTFMNPPASMTVSCANAPTGTPPSLSYSNGGLGSCDFSGMVPAVQSGSSDICGGTITNTWEVTDPCGNTITHVQTITVEPAPVAAFVNPPANMTVTCANAPTGPAAALSYTNGESGSCAISGSVPAVQSGSADICGGTITYTWQFTDVCGRPIQHVQTITVDPAPIAAFVNPPANMTVSCANAPTGPAAPLSYTNGESGSCAISGSVATVQSGSSDICGGTITNTWNFTDECGRPITHVQTITVDPAPVAAFINPPANQTVSCANIPTAPPPALSYTNGATGSCEIAGSVPAVESGGADACGGTITYTWEYVDNCGRPITHVQTITVEPAPVAAFINPPPNQTVSCVNAPSGPAAPLSYTNGASGDCLISGSVSPVTTGVFGICGNTITNTWTFTDDCGRPITHVQVITIQPAPQAAFTNLPASYTASCADIPTGPAPALSYTNGSSGNCLIAGSVNAVITDNTSVCGGELVYTWTFTDDCGFTIQHVQTITAQQVPPATFTSLPASGTFTCDNIPSGSANALNYTNGESGSCAIQGSVDPVQTGSLDACGGTLTNDWSFTDACNRTITHQQNLVVNPGALPAFINPPPNVTVNCGEIPADILTPLSYTNGLNNDCALSGQVNPFIVSGVDECGGDLVVRWEYISPCGDVITNDRIITVLPVPDPIFIDPPADLVLGCNEDFPINPPLAYDNGGQGDCQISGTVTPQTIVVSDVEQVYRWVYTSNCTGATLVHLQNVTLQEGLEITVTPTEVTICEGGAFDLDSVNVMATNGEMLTITFHSATPADTGNELPSSMVSPTDTTTYHILADDGNGCTVEATFVINIEAAPDAGEDGSDQICAADAASVDIATLLGGNPQPGGSWLDPDATNVNLIDPEDVDMSGLMAGSYTFQYVTAAGGECTPDTANVEIELLPPVEFEILSLNCSADLMFYDVFIDAGNLTITNSGGGTLNDLGGGQFSVTGIPIANSIDVTGTNPDNLDCSTTVTVSPPDCNCPNVAPPVAGGPFVICAGEVNPALTVTVMAGQTANWYDTPTGGTPFLSAALSFTPTETAVGVYEYYVEAEELVDGCVSSLRTLVSLEINANPAGNNATLTLCDTDQDGLALFDLTDAQPQISNVPGLAFTYYASFEDAEMGEDALGTDYINTTPFAQLVFVVVENGDGCTSIVELELIVNLPPVLAFDVTNETCLGDSDGTLMVTTPPGESYSINGTDFTSDPFFPDLAAGDYVLYVENTAGCVDSADFNVAVGLELTLSIFNFSCDNNGTSSDPDDDFYTFNFTVDNNQGNAGTYTAFDGTTNWGSFTYGDLNSWTLPAGTPAFTVTFTDDSTGCSTEESVPDLTPCSSDCQLTADTFESVCSDNGTDEDPSDDFYTFTVNVSAQNGSVANTYDILVGAGLIGTYNYGETITFTLPADGSSPNVRFADTESPFCLLDQSVGPLVPCSGGCTLLETVANILCDDNGTGLDPTDDTFTFELTISGVNLNGSTSWSAEPGGWSGTYGTTTIIGPFPIGDGPQNLTITDDANMECPVTIDVMPPTACSDDCALEIVDLTVSCNDNGTIADDTDDFYDITVDATAINITPADSFNVLVDGNLQSVFAYGEGGSFTLPADGSSPLIEFMDVGQDTCLIGQEIGPLVPCNGACELIVIPGEIICDDNGTNDPGDDVFFFEITITGENTSGTWNLLDSTEVHPYDVVVVFGPFPIDSGAVTLGIVDTENENCAIGVAVDPPPTCSPVCSISAVATEPVCDDNGTNDPSDDTYTFQLTVTGENTSGGWLAADSNEVHPYGTAVTFGPYLIANGPVSITVLDTLENNCTAEVMIVPPATCSPVCSISATTTNLICDDNGTNDPGDDTFTFEVLVTGENASGNWLVAGSADPQPYGVAITFGPYPVAGGTVNLDILDELEADCTTGVSVDAPTTCSPVCSITATATDPICDDNGTNDPGDDTFTFEVMVTGENTSGNWQIAGSADPQPYGVAVTFGPYPVAGGTVSLDIVDALEGTCMTGVSVDAPATCSPVCDLNIVMFNLECNNNGTITDPDDDFYVFSVEVTVENPGPAGQFEVLAAGNSVGTFTYGTVATFELPADGSTPLIEVRDVSENGCADDQLSPELIPCAENCLLQSSVTAISCNDLGTNMDPSDDTFTFELIINGQNTSGQWQTADGSLSGSYGMVVTAGPYPIAGGNVELIIQDSENPDCQTVALLVPPPPCSFCPQEVNAGSDGELNCTVTSTVLQGSSSEEGVFQWWLGEQLISTGLDAVVDQAGLYTLIGSYEGGCIATDAALVTSAFEPPAVSSLEVFPELCDGLNNGNIVMQPITGGTPPYDVFLDGQAVGSSGLYGGLSPGEYFLEIIDDNGCRMDTVLTVDAGPGLTLDLIPFLELEIGETQQVRGVVNVPVEELAIVQWSPPENLSCDTCLVTNITGENSLTYILDVVHQNGCRASAPLQVLAPDELGVYIPSAFSPNGDGTNDIFLLFAEERVEEVLSVNIFDRWGNMVFQNYDFQPNTPAQGWDGTLNGEPMNPAVFVYMYKLRLEDGSEVVYSGDITLIR